MGSRCILSPSPPVIPPVLVVRSSSPEPAVQGLRLVRPDYTPLPLANSSLGLNIYVLCRPSSVADVLLWRWECLILIDAIVAQLVIDWMTVIFCIDSEVTFDVTETPWVTIETNTIATNVSSSCRQVHQVPRLAGNDSTLLLFMSSHGTIEHI